MVRPVEDWLSLREFVAGLRSELRAAHDDAEQSDEAADGAEAGEPRFVVGPVTVEFTMVAKKDAEAKGGVRFYVFELGASGSVGTESTQRVNLVLNPVTEDGDPYKVSNTVPDDAE
jgi:hypothetical protein